MNSKSIISRLLLFALGACLFVGSATFAQTAAPSQKNVLEPIAPLINENTILVARFDVDSFDYKRFGETLHTLFNQAIELAGFSQESSAACNAEFEKTLDAFKTDGKEFVEKFKGEQGFSTAFFVMQTVKGDGACLVIPAKGMSKEQVKKITDVLEKSGKMKAALYKKSYILASGIPLKKLGAYYKGFEPAPNRKIETFFNENSDKIFAFYTSRFKIRPLCTPSKEELEKMRQEMLKAAKEAYEKQKLQGKDDSQDSDEIENPFEPGKTSVLAFDPKDYDPFFNSPQCIRNVVEVFDTAFVGAQGYIDASNLTANLTLEFNTAVSSGKFIDALEDVTDEFVPLVFNNLQRISDMNYAVSLPGFGKASTTNLAFIKEYRLAPLWRELTRGDLKRLMPKSYDTKVVFEWAAVESMKKIGSDSVFVATLFGFLSVGSLQYFKEEIEDDEKEFQPFDDVKPIDEVLKFPVEQTTEQAPEDAAGEVIKEITESPAP